MRPTTSYRLTVVGPREASHLHAIADRLVATADEVTTVDQSGITLAEGIAFVRFREKTDDAAALALAREIAGTDSFTLTTGYGVHQRVIA